MMTEICNLICVDNKKGKIMNKYSSLIIAIGAISLSACDAGPDSPIGFSLPEGDVVNGQLAFTKHQCLACHSLEKVDAGAVEPELEKKVPLGGMTSKVTTYADLVTSIINPSHKIARRYKLSAIDESGLSKMRNYNDIMTVTELVDMVSYLQPHYKLRPNPYTPYGDYYIH
jgi:sulfur-oxidizing protein SoxX